MAGAAAALTGLILVAVSINLEQILELTALPRRAVETLSILTGLLLAELVRGFFGAVVNAWVLLAEIQR